MLPLGFSMYSLNLGSDTLIFFSTYQLISGNFLISLSFSFRYPYLRRHYLSQLLCRLYFLLVLTYLIIYMTTKKIYNLLRSESKHFASSPTQARTNHLFCPSVLLFWKVEQTVDVPNNQLNPLHAACNMHEARQFIQRPFLRYARRLDR